MPKIDIDAAPTGHGTTYPEEFAEPCKPRRRWKLGDAVGLDQFGVICSGFRPVPGRASATGIRPRTSSSGSCRARSS